MNGIELTRGVAAYGFERHVRLANAHIELLFATEFGPRILSFGPRGGDNVFAFLEASDPPETVDRFRIYGGHRLWVAPETLDLTYAPDNTTVEWRATAGGAVVTGPVDRAGLVKEIEITLDPSAPLVRVVHRITNRGRAVEIAPWSLSALRPGGVGIVPNARFVPHPEGLLPARTIVQWPYTWMGDPRFRWGRKFVRLAQDPTSTSPQKIGGYIEKGWAAYAVEGTLFVKYFSVNPGVYPDMGCNFETYTDHRFLELESLGPLVVLGTGDSVDHVENWAVVPGVALPEEDDELEALLELLLLVGPHEASKRL